MFELYYDTRIHEHHFSNIYQKLRNCEKEMKLYFVPVKVKLI